MRETTESNRISNLADLVDRTRVPVLTAHRLQLIARQLHRLDEAACNGDLTPRQETRERNLTQEAVDLLQGLGLVLRRQQDPRGWPIYIGPWPLDRDGGTGVCPH